MLTTLFSSRSSAEASTTTATKPAPHLGADRIHARVHMNRAFDELYSSPPSRRGEESDRGRFAARRRHGFTQLAFSAHRLRCTPCLGNQAGKLSKYRRREECKGRVAGSRRHASRSSVRVQRRGRGRTRTTPPSPLLARLDLPVRLLSRRYWGKSGHISAGVVGRAVPAWPQKMPAVSWVPPVVLTRWEPS